jgi:hypothetical protein
MPAGVALVLFVAMTMAPLAVLYIHDVFFSQPQRRPKVSATVLLLVIAAVQLVVVMGMGGTVEAVLLVFTGAASGAGAGGGVKGTEVGPLL